MAEKWCAGGSTPQLSRGDGMKTNHRVLIKLLGKWRQRTKWSDYLSSPLVWLGSSSLPHSTKRNPLVDTRESPLRHCRLSSLPLMSPLQVEALKRLGGERIEINENNP